MFTGLIEEIGTIQTIDPLGSGLRFSINAEKIADDVSLGESIAVNGVCLTVVAASKAQFSTEAVYETLSRSNLGTLKSGDKVNLERSLKPTSRLGGHFVQGHVDATDEAITLR